MEHLSENIKIRIAKSINNGTPIALVSKILNIHRNTLSKWKFIYKNKKKLIRKEGSGAKSKIDPESAKKLIKMLKRNAREFGFSDDLWTLPRVVKLCKKELKIKVSRMAVWRTFDKLDFTNKKPVRNYYETDIKKQKEWLKNQVEEIKSTVKKKRAILYFEDESNISLSPVVGTTWAPKGKKVKVKVTGNWGSISAISAVSSVGHLIFNLHGNNKRYNSNDIIEFIQKILDHHKGRNIVLVMDQATCHTSKKVKDYIANQKKLTVFYFPPRNPELNPDEQIWFYLKNMALKNHTKNNLPDLMKLTKEKLKKLSKDEEKIIKIMHKSDYAHLFLDN